MATFDQLGPEERAVLELLLKRGRSYASVAEALDLEEERVAELAHAALADLTPITSEEVDELDRGAIGNWVIGQATRGEAADAKAALGRHGAARAWASSLLDALDGVASAGTLPELPELERGRAKRAGGGASAAGDDDAGLRRFLVPGLGALAAILAVVVVIMLVTGGDDDKGDGGGDGTTTNTAAQNQQQPTPEKLGELKAQGGEDATAVAAVYDQNGQKVLLVQAQLKKSTDKDAYEVWLYNSDSDAQGVGVQVTDANGMLQGTAQLPADYTKYKNIVISREKRNTEPKKPTKIIVQGALSDPPAQTGNQGGTGGQGGGSGTTTTPGTGTTTTP